MSNLKETLFAQRRQTGCFAQLDAIDGRFLHLKVELLEKHADMRYTSGTDSLAFPP